jgi:SAM-dependent methyltransferase
VLPRRGRALDVACGRGRNAVWLAERGLDVVAIDISPVALSRVRRAAARSGVAERVRTVERDLDDGLPAFRRRFDVVLCIGFHDPALQPALRRVTAPGGLLVLEALARVPPNAEIDTRFLASEDELLAAAGGFRVLRLDAGASGGHATFRLVARRTDASPAR